MMKAMNMKGKLRFIFVLLVAMLLVIPQFSTTANAATAAADLTVAITDAEGNAKNVTLKDTDGDSYYEIGTADELYAFAAAVNGGNNAINGELTNNITVNTGVLTEMAKEAPDTSAFRIWTPIGTTSYDYIGTFNGTGKTVSGLYLNNTGHPNIGLFGLTSEATIKNVGVVDTYFCGSNMVGGVVGRLSASFGSTAMEYCYFTGVVSGKWYVGGVAGTFLKGKSGTVTVSNCYNTGTVSGTLYVGGVGGRVMDNGPSSYGTIKISNCYNTGTVSGTNYVGGVMGYAYENSNSNSVNTITNCYFDSSKYSGDAIGLNEDSSVEVTNTVGKTSAQFASGEVAYLLQGSQTEQVWGQTIGSQTIPVLGGTKVYQLTCGGDTTFYSNSNTNSDEHNYNKVGVCTICGGKCEHSAYANGVCTACGVACNHSYTNGICTVNGCYEPAVEVTAENYEELGFTAENYEGYLGYYAIGNAGQFYWYKQYAEAQASPTTTSGFSDIIFLKKAVLLNDIDLNPGYTFTVNMDTGMVDVTYDDTTYSLGTGMRGDTSGGNTDFDTNGSVAGTWYNGSTALTESPFPSLTQWEGFAVNRFVLVSIYGQGHKISGLYQNGVRSGGLFGISAGADYYTGHGLYDLTLTNGYICAEESAGGFAGISKVIIQKCVNELTVISKAGKVGGFMGSEYNYASAISESENRGIVIGHSSYIAGFIGELGSAGGGRTTRCVNSGIVLCVSTTDSITVAGFIADATGGASVKDCLLTGTVGSYSTSGSVLGIMPNYSGATATNCLVLGELFGGTSIYVVGGGSQQNCYYAEDLATAGAVGTATLVTDDQLKNGEVAWLLNKGVTDGTQTWYQTLGTDAYPKFAGETVYAICDHEKAFANTASTTPTTYENSLCTICGASEYEDDGFNLAGDKYQPATETTGKYDVDGDGQIDADAVVYEISNAGQLFWFAGLVNGTLEGVEQNKTANAILLNDIDLEGRAWDTIAETGLYYSAYGDDDGYGGTFNGNSHVIKNLSLYSSTTIDASCGLFGTLSGTVKNLGIDGVTFTDGGYDIRAGAVAGQVIKTGHIKNCYVLNATITPGAHVTGGIAGCVYDGTIENCYVANSSIDGTANRYGFIVGDSRADGGASDRPGTVKNCYTDGSVAYSERTGSITDCVANITAEQFASGEIAFKLNGDQSSIVFKQNLGDAGDPLPSFTGATVYLTCDHDGNYTNTETDNTQWEYVNGFCNICGAYEPATLVTEENYASLNLTADHVGYYAIGNLGQLMWFGENVVSTKHSAILTADITIDNTVVWKPMTLSDGTANSSIFDGGGHTITFANTNAGSSFGLFGSYNYSVIKNLYLAGSITCNTTGNVGVLVNSAYRTTISNVISTCSITNSATSGGTGGLAGYFGGQDANGLYTLIENCAVYADVIGGGSAGGFIGNIWGGYQYCTVRNCAYVGNVQGAVNTGAIVGNNGNNSSTTSTFSNVYFCEADGSGWIGSAGSGKTNITNMEAKTAQQFASGEVAWLLNGSSAETPVWKQTLGIHAYPGFEGGIVNYDNTTYTNSGDYVSVTITWTEMSFTYVHGTWDPKTHTFGEGTWTPKEGGGKITVQNNASPVYVSLSFAGSVDGVSGSFDKTSDALAKSATATYSLTLTGQPTGEGFKDQQLGTVSIKLSLNPDTSGWKVGDKVTYIAKDGNVYTCTVAELNVTSGKAVLLSDTSFRTGNGTTSAETLYKLVEDKGARWPIYTGGINEKVDAVDCEPALQLMLDWLKSNLGSLSSSGVNKSVVVKNGTLYTIGTNSLGVRIGSNTYYNNNNYWIGRYIWDVPLSD